MSEVMMKYGKHKGLPMTEVPMSYLTWYVANIATPAGYIVDELKRRSEQYGSRDALVAASALSSLLYTQAAGKSSGRRQRKKKLRRNRRGR